MTHTNIAFCEGAKQILLTQEESALDSAKKTAFPTNALFPPAKGSRIPRLQAHRTGFSDE